MKLSEARARKLYTVSRLAKETGVTRGHLYGIERGKWTPSLDLVAKICEVLNLEDPTEIDEFRVAIQRSAEGRVRGKEVPVAASS
jgi:DNA-binding XRE family transcriptional regulator